ncbi:zf-HC2 domain-containing protein [Streptomyces sp. CAU 1734]|uniref:zf-HC2 domain-containing protein n=1 Tax=Streptomyces sp. CAU 1734 TaxID=3140360 RepID=UPI0032617B62
MSGWHVSEQLARGYADGSATEPDAWSLEKHLESCGACAVRVSAAVRAGSAGPVIGLVRSAVLAEAAGAEGVTSGAGAAPGDTAGAGAPVARRSGRTGWAVRMFWAAGPALRGPWLVALALVTGGALFLAYGVGFSHTRTLLLTLSPALPLAGVALSYGRYADPLYEIVAATPGGGLRLLLTRTALVLAVSVLLLAGTGALLPPGASGVAGVPGAAAWLLPALALTLAALAAGSYVGCRAAACALSGGWIAIVLVPYPARGTQRAAFLADLVSGPGSQGGWAAAAVVCAGLLAARRSSFDHLERVR